MAARSPPDSAHRSRRRPAGRACSAQLEPAGGAAVAATAARGVALGAGGGGELAASAGARAVTLPVRPRGTPRENVISAFTDLGLKPPLLAAIREVGYEAPTAIQARTMPALLAGRDVIGQAQTGTGKTAAFAIPILQRLDLAGAGVQALVLTPTRELAMQVAEAVHTYGKHLGGLHVLPVYGGPCRAHPPANAGRHARALIAWPTTASHHELASFRPLPGRLPNGRTCCMGCEDRFALLCHLAHGMDQPATPAPFRIPGRTRGDRVSSTLWT
jgi:hypothetical protein